MKVLITNFHPSGGGGHTTYIYSLATGLLKFGIEPVIACPPSSLLYRRLKEFGKVSVEEVEFPHNGKEIKGIMTTIKKLRNIIKRENIGLIHVNGSPDHWISIYYKLLFCSNIPVVRTRHSMLPVKNTWASHFQQMVTSKTITVCHAQKDMYGRQPVFKGSEIDVIPNGVNIDHFSPRPKDGKIKKKYGIQYNDFVFGSCGGVAKHKGVDVFIKAAARLIKMDPNIKIMVLGAEITDYFQNLVNQLGISKNVIFTGFQMDVRPFFSVFDFGFLLSNAIETISFATREMMSMGKPLIVSDFGGLPENINDGIDGFIVKGGSEKLLTEILLRIYDERDLAIKMGLKARQQAENEFNEKDFLEKTAKVYESACS
jgi:L-malate glycosyltransferase